MLHPTTSLLIPSIAEIPAVYRGDNDKYRGFSDYFYALGYPIRNQQPYEHFAASLQARYPDSNRPFFGVIPTVYPELGIASFALSHNFNTPLVFDSRIARNMEFRGHFLNLLSHHLISRFFPLCNSRMLEEEFMFHYYMGNDSYEELKKYDPDYVEDYESRYGKMWPNLRQLIRNEAGSPPELDIDDSTEFLQPYGFSGDILNLLESIDFLESEALPSDASPFDEDPIEPIFLSNFDEPSNIEWNYIESLNEQLNSYGYVYASKHWVDLGSGCPLEAAYRFDCACHRIHSAADLYVSFLDQVVTEFRPG